MTRGAPCPFCRTPAEGHTITCSACGLEYHDDCWAENQGCAVPGCAARPNESSAVAEPDTTAPRSDVVPVIAGRWEPDPMHRHGYRWWNGNLWTDWVSDNGQTSVDPLHPAPPAPVTPPSRSEWPHATNQVSRPVAPQWPQSTPNPPSSRPASQPTSPPSPAATPAATTLPNSPGPSQQFFTSQQMRRPSAAFQTPGAASPGLPSAVPYDAAGMHLLGRWTQGLLIASGALFGLAALVGVNAWSVYTSWLEGSASVRQSISADDSYWGAVGLAYLVMVPTIIVMIVWMYRYWDQLRSLNSGAGQRWSRGWTIGGWFIPIGNLWIPKQIIDDFWKSSVSLNSGDLPQRVPPLLHWWWASWLAGSFLMQISGAVSPLTESGWHTFYLISVLGAGLMAASGALAAVLVGNLARRLGAMATMKGSGASNGVA
jgi:hypothetical protein